MFCNLFLAVFSLFFFFFLFFFYHLPRARQTPGARRTRWRRCIARVLLLNLDFNVKLKWSNQR